MVIKRHLFLEGEKIEKTNYQRGLPSILEQIRDSAVKQLDSLLLEMFDNADDVLFDLADKAHSDTEQSMYFNSMRELRIKRKGMERLFSQSLKNTFHKLQFIEKPPEESNLQELNAQSLSLVHEDELEEDLAFDSMVTKANSHYVAYLIPIVTRMDTLLANHRIDKSNNPINPKSICESFHLASKQLELEIKPKLVLFKLFDRMVISKLDKLYKEVNGYLINEGVLPDLTGYGSVQKKPSLQKRAAADNWQQNENAVTHGADSGADFLGELRSLLSRQASSTQTSSTQTNNESLTDVVDNLQLVKALSALQEGSEQHPVTEHSYFPVSELRNQLEAVLPISTPVSRHTVGQVNDDIINVISMLFDFILDDKNLPDEFKILISRLQIPVLKVAVIDTTFFSKGSHPARKLLNEMAHAGVGWTEDSETGVFGLRAKVEKIVTHIIDEFDDDAALFTEALDEFNDFIKIHRKRISLLEKRMQEAEEGKAKAESARTHAEDALKKIVDNHQLPEVAHKIIFDVWQNVMSLTYLREGNKSEAWQQNIKVAKDLMNSLTVPRTNQLKESLEKNITKLADHIKSGLDSVGYSEFESQDLLGSLEQLHTKVLSGEEVLITLPQENNLVADTETPDEASLPNVDDLSIELTKIENENKEQGKTLLLDEPVSQKKEVAIDADSKDSQDLGSYFDSSLVDNGSMYEDDEIMQLVDELQAGSWFELNLDGKTTRVKLAAIISVVGKYLFVNNTGKKVAEYSRLELILEFRRNKIVQLDDGSLFDRALKSIVSDFRIQKQYRDSGF
ncbi:MAG: hypothetical protein DRQ47_02970 [Gammaproteobacteria bacterium]|nr:MAG: hypothetical protein DRQ47_02970 [Gammaproteobacteria bacterium]